MIEAWVFWIVAAAVLFVAEMVTGTFYLLLAAIGALAASALAYAGQDMIVQIIAAAVVTFIGWVIVNKFRPLKKGGTWNTNADVNLDIGAQVRIAELNPTGKIYVQYRGSRWEAVMAQDIAAEAGKDYTIVAIEGSRLVLGNK